MSTEEPTPVTLNAFQQLMDSLYGEGDRERGRPATVAWLAEEVGELAQAVRKGTAAEQLHELGDVLAWLASLANQLGLSLDDAARRYLEDPPMGDTSHPTRIFHIIAPDDWARAEDPYRHPSLDAEGFIHFSTAEQAVATTGRYYADAANLVLLEVDTLQLTSDLRWEASANTTTPTAGLFPHLYGPMPKAAVVAEHPWNAQDRAAWPG